MPFSKLEIDRRIVSWNQVMYTLMEAPARNRPRLWAVANLLAGLDEGMTREEFAVGYCIGARQLRRWIKRFNEGGLEGLLFRSRRRRGPKRKISADKYNSELLPLIQELRASDGKASARKLWQLAKARLGYDISYAGMLRTLSRHGTRFRPRPKTYSYGKAGEPKADYATR
jgi:transposase